MDGQTDKWTDLYLVQHPVFQIPNSVYLVDQNHIEPSRKVPINYQCFHYCINFKQQH